MSGNQAGFTAFGAQKIRSVGHFDFVIGACSYSVKTRGVLEDEEPDSGLTSVSQVPALGLVSPPSSYSRNRSPFGLRPQRHGILTADK